MKAQTLFTLAAIATLQHSYAAVSWVPAGPPTVSANFANSSAAASGGWDEFAGTFTQTNLPGADGANGFMMLKDTDGLDGPNDNFTFSRQGRTSTFPGSYAVLTSIYLDNTWSAGSGFDYSTAINNSTGVHLRDFATSVGFDGTNFFFAASNNVDFNAIGALNPSKKPINLGALSSGWYNLQTVFYDVNGFLTSDMNLLDSSGNILATKTITTQDAMSGVGGHRYAWMTGISTDNDNQLAIDNYRIQNIQIIPEPSIAFLGSLAGFLLLRRRRA
ncbi:hypothetical protein ACFQY0_04805 [Haloferula chungangensis]|uniref:PEP-CTERM sorting domain-containing protein n=1 Tax=Haloferula chungangensis TaxID=1048331 RepID=A0ABW2L432_9BACT